MTKKILITGGAGFIGKNLTKRLLAEGHHVTCLDNFSSSDKKNLTGFQKNKQFQHITHDVTEPFHVDCEQIYHLACPASPPRYQADPLATMRTAIWGTYNALELAKKTGARLIIASTSEIYGDPHVHPQPESYWGNVNTIGIRSCYDEGKRAGETLAVDAVRQWGIDARIVRIFNTYGPEMDPEDGRVVSNFIMQALQNQPLTLYGDGSQTRSFCYVADLLDGLIAAMTHEHFQGPVNLGNPNEFTVKALAEKVIQLTGSSSELQYLPLPSDDPKVRRPDIALAKATYGWEPTIQLEAGLKLTIPYFAGRIST
jgi:UDP-glucuronate decarboxylase